MSEQGDPRGDAPPPEEGDYYGGNGGGGGDPRDRGGSRGGGGRAVALRPAGEARLPYPAEIAEEYDLKHGTWLALTDSVFPMAKTVGAIVLALAYCRDRKLDIMKKPVHIVPMWNSELGREVETVWPAITEHRITAHRTGEFAGMDPAVFGETIRDREFAEKYDKDRPAWLKGKIIKAKLSAYPEWAQITVYRVVKGQARAFPGPRIYFEEYFGMQHGLAVPNARWARAPFQMLEKCAEAAALRRAFTEELGNMPVADEMEDRIIAQHIPFADKEEPRPDPARATRAATPTPRNETRRDSNVTDAVFTEVKEDGKGKAETDNKKGNAGPDDKKGKPAEAKGPAPSDDGKKKEEPKPEPVRDRLLDYVREQIEASKKLDEPTLMAADEQVRGTIKTEGPERDDLLKLWIVAFDKRTEVLKRPPLSEADQAYEDWKSDQYKRLETASMTRTVDDIEDEVMPNLKDADKAAFKEACNQRAKAIFASKQKR